MRLSIFRTGVVASAAAIALAACGGHGLVPQSAAPGSNAVVPMSSNPCYTNAVQPAWIFKGTCVIKKLSSKGTTFTLAAYKGISLTAKLPANTAKLSPFVIVDAQYKNGDITTFSGAPFPKFTSKQVKTLIYIQAINGAKKGVMFTKGSLKFTVKAATFPGKNCLLSYLAQGKSGFAWQSTPLAGAVTSGQVTITVPASLLAQLFSKTGGALPPGPLYLNFSCK